MHNTPSPVDSSAELDSSTGRQSTQGTSLHLIHVHLIVAIQTYTSTVVLWMTIIHLYFRLTVSPTVRDSGRQRRPPCPPTTDSHDATCT